ncbi:MAG: HD domain-containing phosphohydrolase [Acidimicrobiales bacterium]
MVSLLLPAAVGFLAVWASMVVVAKPKTLLLLLPWLALMVAAAFAGMRVANFATRRLAPLRALFQMSLVFPDAAPSRFGAALRAHTGRDLGRSVAIPATFESNQAAAEHLVELLARLSAHDRLTRGHSERVRAFSVMLGEEIGLNKNDLIKLNWASLAHDVGKLHVPESVLNKNGRPSDDEWTVLKSHPGHAEKYVRSLRPWLGDWVDCATQHHERIDGKGYPDGLAGEEISLSGRIVSIADAFDVMTATRSYKRPQPASQARAELLRNAGTQFDAALVRSFLQISIPRQRMITGWLGWLAHLPTMLRLPAIPAAVQSVGGVVAAGTITAAAVIATPLTELPEEEVSFAVERAVEDDEAPGSTVPDDPTDLAPAPTTTTPRATTTAGDPTPTTTAADPLAPATTRDPSDPTPTTTASPATTTTAGTGTTTTATAGTDATTTTTASTGTTTTTTTTTTLAPAVTEANDDSTTVLLGVGRTVAVLANDDFGTSSANTTTLAVVAGPSRGTTSVNQATGEITWSPTGLPIGGSDSFVYRICSMAGSCDTAMVTINIVV